MLHSVHWIAAHLEMSGCRFDLDSDIRVGIFDILEGEGIARFFKALIRNDYQSVLPLSLETLN